MKRRRVALYGGSFDPVHLGHLAVAESLARLFHLDEVLFLPARIAPHKRDAPPTSPFHRHAMLALAIDGEERFRISLAELEGDELHYTIDTLRYFRSLLKNSTKLFFVMGADSWRDITTWKDWEGVLMSVSHLVFTRPGYDFDDGHITAAARERIVDLRGASQQEIDQALEDGGGEKVFWTDAVMKNVSSTEIRRSARDQQTNLAGMVPASVANYIKKYGLYTDEHETEFTDAGKHRAH
ncbi:MAG: nicotinate (nicotinamide) nucleotide adenylyltransferase [Pyrinomonadaceae bacterium]|nr:nicotinate (nicotinamide) nucleotide adenylyltransferase [Pyrinomonadaceae bacterium]